MRTTIAILNPFKMVLNQCAFVAVLLVLFTSCSKDQPPSVAGNPAIQERSSQLAEQKTNQFDYADYQRRKEAALGQAENLREQARTNPPEREVPLPNFESRAHLPKPLGINFYEKRDYYPGYLLCRYDVSENHYDTSNEPAWFEAALMQMRGNGRYNFPNVKWVAIIIVNNADSHGTNTFEYAHKTGAIFPFNDVFADNSNLRGVIAQALVDRHPFQFDTNRATPGEQNRWLIVERHMDANRTGPVPLQRD
jgi:hypothetical protein